MTSSSASAISTFLDHDPVQRGALTPEELRRFRVAMDTSGDSIYLVDRASMRFIDVNRTACERMGFSREALLGMGPQDLLFCSREEIERDYDEVIASGARGFTREAPARTMSGRTFYTELHRRALFLDGRWIIVSIARDITRRKQAEEQLRQNEAELRLLSDNVPAMILYVDRDMNCAYANRCYAEYYGLRSAELMGKSLRAIIGDAAHAVLEPYFEKALEGHPVTFELDERTGDVNQRCLEVKLVPRPADAGMIHGCYYMAVDITEQRLARERLRHVAEHDGLTGLPNRLLFNDRLGQAISLARRVARRFALLYIDLDKFKAVNDTRGHPCGDRILKAAAERIREQVRESDTVARVGGDEFAVILLDTAKPQDVDAVAQKIVAALSTPFVLGDDQGPIVIGASIGVAVYPDHAQDQDSLVRMADAAMYRAKGKGNCVQSFAS